MVEIKDNKKTNKKATKKTPKVEVKVAPKKKTETKNPAKKPKQNWKKNAEILCDELKDTYATLAFYRTKICAVLSEIDKPLEPKGWFNHAYLKSEVDTKLEKIERLLKQRENRKIFIDKRKK